MRTGDRGAARRRRHRRALILLACAAFAAALFVAPAARAAFHLMSIREVYPGGADNASYVELQMWTSGQQFVAGHHIVAYNANGSVNHDFTFSSSPSNGANQATILVADTSYASVFPSGPTPDASDAELNLSPAGGAVCWTESSPPDCVAWGNFTGPLPSPSLLVGTPASSGGVSAGKALQRTIVPNCETLLEPADDSDDSATDFSEQTPNPRSNASPIPEHNCPPPVDETPPVATIDSHPADPSPGTSVTFKYHSNEGGSTFQCSLTSGGADSFSSCASTGRTYTNLADGDYTFKVRAKDLAGNQGLPASYSWEVDNSLADTDPPETTIDSHPPNPSGSASASFTYHADEPGSTFECKLDGAAFSACPSGGIAYDGLGNGGHTFQVRATDPSANTDPTPAGYSFDVVIAGASSSPPPAPPPPPPPPPPATEPTAPPQTRITRAPRGPTRDRTPTFRFRANVAAARFQCKVDRSRFRGCRSPFTSERLRFGRHLFRVRAIAGGAADPTPAKAGFKVVRGKRKAKRRRGRGSKRHRAQRAHASIFHLVSLRELHPGSAANPGAEYVELQMYASGQEFVGGHVVRTYDASGALVKSNVIGSDVASGANQRTVLLATPEAESQFGVTADAALSPSNQLDPSGGAVCWESLDCVAWGNFSGATASPSGPPADPAGIPDGMALRRTIAPGCPTLLEFSDDSNSSAADFADVFPAPRPNSATPSERACGGQLPGGGNQAGNQQGGGSAAKRRRPQTRIRRHPPRRTRDRTPTFRFSSTVRRSTYLCKLDRRRFRRCRPRFTAPRLRLGRHVLRVKARAPWGAVDRTPAIYRFRVIGRGKRASER